MNAAVTSVPNGSSFARFRLSGVAASSSRASCRRAEKNATTASSTASPTYAGVVAKTGQCTPIGAPNNVPASRSFGSPPTTARENRL
jgi:hypothetical protein